MRIEEKIEGAIPNDRFGSLADTTCNTLIGREPREGSPSRACLHTFNSCDKSLTLATVTSFQSFFPIVDWHSQPVSASANRSCLDLAFFGTPDPRQNRQ